MCAATSKIADTHHMSETTHVTHIAAYGTLRSEHENHVRSGMAEHVKSLGTHRIPGRMYVVPNTGYAGQGGPDYPGAIFDPQSDSTVEVELFQITGDQDKVLALLDDFENDNPVNPEYRRITLNIDGVPAYLYEYVRPVAGYTQIQSGVWPNIKRQASGHVSLKFSDDCSRWMCPQCGANGSDGYDSPSDYPCRTR
jgi:gamma-glutamylcyclotransferase (GGCT)/AIG2-like uncharacterized protein YtfP